MPAYCCILLDLNSIRVCKCFCVRAFYIYGPIFVQFGARDMNTVPLNFVKFREKWRSSKFRYTLIPLKPVYV